MLRYYYVGVAAAARHSHVMDEDDFSMLQVTSKIESNQSPEQSISNLVQSNSLVELDSNEAFLNQIKDDQMRDTVGGLATLANRADQGTIQKRISLDCITIVFFYGLSGAK